MVVAARERPVAGNPSVAILVGLGEGHGLLDGNELAAQALPEVETILGWLQRGVCNAHQRLIVWHRENVSAVQAAELLGWRVWRVLPNDQGRHLVPAADLGLQRGARDLGQVEVVLVGPVLEHFSAKRDCVADGQVCAERAAIDIDGLRGALVTVGRGGADPEAIWALCSNDTSYIGHSLPAEGRQKSGAIDVGDGGCRSKSRRGQETEEGRHCTGGQQQASVDGERSVSAVCRPHSRRIDTTFIRRTWPEALSEHHSCAPHGLDALFLFLAVDRVQRMFAHGRQRKCGTVDGKRCLSCLAERWWWTHGWMNAHDTRQGAEGALDEWGRCVVTRLSGGDESSFSYQPHRRDNTRVLDRRRYVAWCRRRGVQPAGKAHVRPTMVPVGKMHVGGGHGRDGDRRAGRD